MTFIDKLQRRWRQSGAFACVGLDSDYARLPDCLTHLPHHEALVRFNTAIVDACAPYVCAFKPQIAYYASAAMEAALADTIAYLKSRYPDIPVILDSKRGDIGSTASHYAKEAFERFDADAVTVNPYLGRDSVQPFLDYADRGVIVLCRTSNPGSAEFQSLIVAADDKPLFEHVAHRVSAHWNDHGNCLLVVGATYPAELKIIRGIVGDMPILVPGVGAQGGVLDAVLAAGLTQNKDGLVINSSRAIIYAGDGEDFAEAAGTAAEQLHLAICATMAAS